MKYLQEFKNSLCPSMNSFVMKLLRNLKIIENTDARLNRALPFILAFKYMLNWLLNWSH